MSLARDVRQSTPGLGSRRPRSVPSRSLRPVEAFGKRLTGKARADHSRTPDGEYWDLRKRAPHVDWAQQILASRSAPSPQGWLR